MITAWLAITVATVASTTIGYERPVGIEQKERIFERLRLGKDQSALPQIIERERRQHERKPGNLDRTAAEMAEIGIKRLGAGHGQETPRRACKGR